MTKKEPREFVIPEWAKILKEEPLKLDEETDIKSFVVELERRLEALFHLFNCKPTPNGWRALALKLASGYMNFDRSPIQILTPNDDKRLAVKPDTRTLDRFWVREIEWQMRHPLRGEAEVDIKSASERVRKKYEKMNRLLKRKGEKEIGIPKTGTFQNKYTKHNIVHNGQLEAKDWNSIKNALMKIAGKRLSERSQIDPV